MVMLVLKLKTGHSSSTLFVWFIQWCDSNYTEWVIKKEISGAVLDRKRRKFPQSCFCSRYGDKGTGCMAEESCFDSRNKQELFPSTKLSMFPGTPPASNSKCCVGPFFWNKSTGAWGSPLTFT